jgi:FixJ family two-component response regulator
MTDLNRSNIAVVDNDSRVLESLESLLESAGYRVHLFSSAENFVRARVLQEIDCLISDISMPGIGGFELLKLVQQDRPGLPVILITAHQEMMKSRFIEKLEPDRFFARPFDGKKFLTAVDVATK